METLEFIPFGAQYYRYPTPLEQEWETDLANMKEAGFNTIKIWAMWRTNQPREGEYDFRDIDRLMDLAQENNLNVIINVIFDAAPSWFFRKYPESMMLTASGRRLTPASNSCRQAGGSPGPCLHHEQGIEIRRGFLTAIAQRYRDHPALWCWDIWNEPEASGALAGSVSEENLLCYCEASRAAFLKWLEKKYSTPQGLNHAWNTTYNDWEEVELPRLGQAFQNMIDWRSFFADTVTEEAKMRIEAVKRQDQKHPVMLHTVPMPYFNAVSGCSDDYALASLCDLFGNSLGSVPFTASITVSAADGKPCISSEIHAVGGSIFGRPNIPSFEDFKRHIFIPLSKGIKGFQFWQYRPETLGIEAPAWGLTKLNGWPTPWFEYAVRLNRALQENSGVLLKAFPRKAEAAVINSNKGQVFTWCAEGKIDKYCASVKGIFDALHENNIAADVLSPDQLTQAKLEQYKAIYFPFPYYVEERTANVLRKWILGGGMLVSEAFFAGVRDTDGLHSTTVPGFGFDGVFGAREDLVMSASNFNNAYSKNWSSENENADEVEIVTEAGLPLIEKGETVSGYYFSEGLEALEGSRILARFGDGRAAAVMRDYGKGGAVLAGTLLGCESGRNKANGRFLASFALLAGVKTTGEAEKDGIRIDGLYDGDDLAAFVLTNNRAEAVSTKATLTGAKSDSVICAMTEETVRTEREGDRLTVWAELGKDDCRLYIMK